MSEKVKEQGGCCGTSTNDNCCTTPETASKPEAKGSCCQKENERTCC